MAILLSFLGICFSIYLVASIKTYDVPKQRLKNQEIAPIIPPIFILDIDVIISNLSNPND